MTHVSERAAVVVAGMMAGVPGHGGATWAVLQYILGLRRLGHEVVFVEELKTAGASVSRYFEAIVKSFGLRDHAALLIEGERKTVGLDFGDLRRAIAGADLLLNISGTLRDPELFSAIPIRLYIDLDPAFNQFWDAEGIDVGFSGHTDYATVGLCLGTEECKVPTSGKEWIKILPPVVLEHWPVADRLEHSALTTVGNFRAYGSIERGGVLYGQKVHSMRELVHLPKMTDERFMLAFDISSDETQDLAAIQEAGWTIVDPRRVAGSPESFRVFVAGSKGEFGLAKSGYVLARCGWFSERSACYLASGRPVIAQETGFGKSLPTGEGLFAFSSVDDVLVAIDELERDYERHRKGARGLAEDSFDSDKVLTRLLDSL